MVDGGSEAAGRLTFAVRVKCGYCKMPSYDKLLPVYGNLGQYRMLRVERTAVNSSVPNEEEAKLESRYFADAFAGVHPEDMERVRSAYKARYAERQLKSSGVLKRGTMM